MVKTIKFRTNIPPDRSLQISVPDDVPTGSVEIEVRITSTGDEPVGTAADLANSPLAGLWADRDDIEESLAYARKLRADAGRRSRA